MKRTETRKIMVGNVQIGGQNKVVIQSMCNTKTKNVEDTVNQILALEKAGCEIIRVACLDIEDAKAIKKIKEKKRKRQCYHYCFEYRSPALWGTRAWRSLHYLRYHCVELFSAYHYAAGRDYRWNTACFKL